MQALNLITDRLEEAGILYCLVGGLAAIAYGRPRLTLDADMVVALLPRQISMLVKAFPIDEFYLPPEEVLLAETQRDSRGHFNILHQQSALRADCYRTGKEKLDLLNDIRLLSMSQAVAEVVESISHVVSCLQIQQEMHSISL